MTAAETTPADDLPETSTQDAAADAGLRTILVVRLGASEFGLPVGAVREVLRTGLVSRVPFPPPHVRGIIGLRGLVVPVVDLGARLLGRPAANHGTLVITGEPDSGEPIALLVDSVAQLIDTATVPHVDPPAEAEATLPAGWVEAVVMPVPDRPITVLDLRMVLPNPASRGPT